MDIPHFTVSTYSPLEAPQMGNYAFCGLELDAQVLQVLKQISSEPQDIPNCPGYVVTGHKVGESYSVTLSVVAKDDDTTPVTTPLATYYFVLDDDDVEHTSRLALAQADLPNSGLPESALFRIIMMNNPPVPHIISIPSPQAMSGAIDFQAVADELEMTQGFISIAFGNALKDFGYQETLDGEFIDRPNELYLSQQDIMVFIPLTHQPLNVVAENSVS